MKNHYKILLLIFLLGAIGLLFYSTWYQWEGHQETAYERLEPQTPSVEFNHIHRESTLPISPMKIAISPKEPHYIVSAREGKDIKVWDRDNPEEPVRVLTKYPFDENIPYNGTRSVFFDSSGKILITNSRRMIVFWDVATWTLIASYRIPSGDAAVSPSENLLATCLFDIDIWDFTNPKDFKKIYKLDNKGIHYFYDSATFSVNGRWFAALIAIPSSKPETEKKKVQIWDLNTKQIFKIIEMEYSNNTTLESKVKDSVMVVSDRGIKYSDLTIDKSDIRTISFSPDNSFFAIGNNFGFTIWSLPDWRIYHQVDNVYVTDLTFSPNGKVIAIASLRGIMIWSIVEMKPIAIYIGNSRIATYYNIAFSPDGKSLVGSGYDSMITLWDMEGIE